MDTFNVTGAAAPASGTISVTGTTSPPSGFPAKNRGIMFDGTNHAVFALPTFVLYHTFAFHSWLYPFTNGSNRYVFSKDRNDFTNADTSKHITFVIGTDNRPLINMAKDEDPTTTHDFQGTSTYDEDTWVYSVISAVMSNGSETSI